MKVDLDDVAGRRQRVLVEIASAADQDERIRVALVVGSVAAGNDDAYSDIDLVVIPEVAAMDSLLADRRVWPARFGDVVLQIDTSWNVWRGASQVLTLLDGELPLWIDMDIWTPDVQGVPLESRVLVGDAPPATEFNLSEFAAQLKELHGPGAPGRCMDGAGGDGRRDSRPCVQTPADTDGSRLTLLPMSTTRAVLATPDR